MTSANDLIRRQERLASDRSTYETHWQEIADFMLPGRGDFIVQRVPGQKRTDKLFDGTALTALDNLSGGLWGAVTNSANKWFEVQTADPALMREHEIAAWCDAVTDRMLAAFGANGMRFYAQAIAAYRDLAAFGTMVFYTEHPDPAQSVLAFESKPLARCFISENDRRRVDTVFERFKYTARQAVQRWGNRAPDKVRKAIETNPEAEFTFLFACMPAKDAGFKLPSSDMTTASVYVCVDTQELVQVGGMYAFPYQVARWSIGNKGPYGDSPAMLALPDVKMVNAMAKTTIVAAQKQADPTILAPDENGMRGVRFTPGGIVYGGVDASGREMYRPFQAGGPTGLTLELENQRRDSIRDAFYATLLLMADNANMTATEWLGRQEEKLRLMGPHIGLVQAEWLDPLVDTAFSLMARASVPMWSRGVDGWLPRPPDSLPASPELKVSFVSPLARAQKASEAASLDRFMQSIIPVAQVRPEVLDNINADEFLRIMAQGTGVPAKVLNDPRMVEQMRTQKAQQAQAMQMVQMAGPMKDGAQAVKTLAEANATAGISGADTEGMAQ